MSEYVSNIHEHYGTIHVIFPNLFDNIKY